MQLGSGLYSQASGAASMAGRAGMAGMQQPLATARGVANGAAGVGRRASSVMGSQMRAVAQRAASFGVAVAKAKITAGLCARPF